MSDNSNSGMGAGIGIGIGLGILIGGFFAFLILRAQKTTEAQVLAQAIPHVPVYPSNAYYQQPPLIIREVQPQPQIQSIAPVLQPAVVQTTEPAATSSSYKNNEDWIIERGERGRLKKIKVIRDARATKE